MTTVNFLEILDYRSGLNARDWISFSIKINNHDSVTYIPIRLDFNEIRSFVAHNEVDCDISLYGDRNLFNVDECPRLGDSCIYKQNGIIVISIFDNRYIIQEVLSSELSKQFNDKLKQLYTDIQDNTVKTQY
jgi:hypothetical protein